MSRPELSCLIPLYRSQRFIHWIEENIQEHLLLGAEVVVSDRHCLDNTAEILRGYHAGNSRVRILTATDGVDWVQNVNGLLQEASGEFARIVPHDDTATSESTALLRDALVQDPRSILATGVVKAQDLEGKRLPERDALNAGEIATGGHDWTLDDALGLYWSGRFAGAFKGLLRLGPVREKNLFVRPTRTLVSSERAWLSGLSLAGSFTFVRGSVLVKRHYPESTHRSWRFTPRVVIDVAKVLRSYASDLVDDREQRERAVRNIFINARSHARWARTLRGAKPGYVSLSETNQTLVR